MNRAEMMETYYRTALEETAEFFELYPISFDVEARQGRNNLIVSGKFTYEGREYRLPKVAQVEEMRYWAVSALTKFLEGAR